MFVVQQFKTVEKQIANKNKKRKIRMKKTKKKKPQFYAISKCFK